MTSLRAITKLVVLALCLIFGAYGVRIVRDADLEVSEDHTEYSSLRRLSVLEAKRAEDHRVISLPGLPSLEQETKHYAGHVLADASKNGFFFYWLFDSPKQSDTKPIIIWLNGGPGCSSMDGMWLELGPFRLSDGGKRVSWNEHSWHNIANLLFIDQPVGTGLSFTSGKDGLAKNDDTISRHFFSFLQNFLKLHSRFVHVEGKTMKSRPIIFAGESHAGHYIPNIVDYILSQNSKIADGAGEGQIQIVVQGLALGNPWIDPPNQYNPAQFAHGLGLLSSGQVKRLMQQEKQCQSQLSEGKLNSKICLSLLDNVIDSTTTGKGAKVVMYDTRQFSVRSQAFPPGHELVEAYLNRPEVRKAIHATEFRGKFVECADPPYYALAHQDGKGVLGELRRVLEKDVPVLIYAGQYDLICNHINLEKVLDNLEWSGQQTWLDAQPGVWLVGSQPAGYVRQGGKLQSLLFLDAGHMVPMDQPARALNMMKRFVEQQSLSAGPSKVAVATPLTTTSTTTTSSSATKAESPAVDLSTPPLCPFITSSSSTPVSGQRQLMERVSSRTSASHVPFVPILLHATAMERAVSVRIRVDALPQSTSSSDSSSNSGVGGFKGSGHFHSRAAWEFLAESAFYLRVDPEQRMVVFNSSWLTAGASASGNTGVDNAQHHHHVDILVEGLRPGVSYELSLQHEYESLSVRLPLSFRRTLHVKVGCYQPGRETCCGHGECVEDADTTSRCKCEVGYSGKYCDGYSVHVAGGQHSMHSSSKSDEQLHDHVNPHSPRHNRSRSLLTTVGSGGGGGAHCLAAATVPAQHALTVRWDALPRFSTSDRNSNTNTQHLIAAPRQSQHQQQGQQQLCRSRDHCCIFLQLRGRALIRSQNSAEALETALVQWALHPQQEQQQQQQQQLQQQLVVKVRLSSGEVLLEICGGEAMSAQIMDRLVSGILRGGGLEIGGWKLEGPVHRPQTATFSSDSAASSPGGEDPLGSWSAESASSSMLHGVSWLMMFILAVGCVCLVFPCCMHMFRSSRR